MMALPITLPPFLYNPDLLVSSSNHPALFQIIGEIQIRPRPSNSVAPYIAAGAPFTEPLSSGSFLTLKIFSVVTLLPDACPKAPAGEAKSAWFPTMLLVAVGVAGVKVDGIN
jgi:hypothetical protein